MSVFRELRQVGVILGTAPFPSLDVTMDVEVSGHSGSRTAHRTVTTVESSIARQV